MGDGFFVGVALITSCQSFYFATLEEYYTGGLFLGIGNGVTDGSVGIMLLFIMSGVFGAESWATEIGQVGGYEVPMNRGQAFFAGVLVW